MYLNLKNALATVAMLTTVVVGLGSEAAFADSADQHNGESQMNHEQMMNSDGEMQMPMQECSDNPDAQMNHQQMSSSEQQMSMQQCSNGSSTEMNHEQMMNSDGEMQMPSNDDSPKN